MSDTESDREEMDSVASDEERDGDVDVEMLDVDESEDEETEDFKGSLQALIKKEFNYSRVFAFSQQYSVRDAPNPCLSIDGIGPVGLPLSGREARFILAEASETINADQLRFENPDWDVWLRDVAAASVLGALSLKGATLVLKHLVLRGPGASSTPSQSSGQLIVILPSRFDGGAHHVRHQSLNKVVTAASHSSRSTTVLGVYPGVEHNIAEVASGYCLSLVYDIVHADTRPLDPVPDMAEPVQRLRRLLQSWNPESPNGALACLLRNKYRRDVRFSAASLKGADEFFLSHLSPLASELGFSLHLAHLETQRYCRGAVESGDGIEGGPHETVEFTDESFVPDDDEPDDVMQVKEIVDLEGMPVRVNGFKEDWENDSQTQWNKVFLCGPWNFFDKNGMGEQLVKPDRVKVERTVTWAGRYIRTWCRTALLIWPTNSSLEENVVAGDLYDYALDYLGDCVSATPTQRETRIAENLLERCRISDARLKEQKKALYNAVKKETLVKAETANIRKAFAVLRECAQRWHDPHLFLRAAEACKAHENIDILGLDALVSAYRAFGWPPIASFCDSAMKSDNSSSRRSALLARLTRLAAEENDQELGKWTRPQEDEILRDLGDVDAGDIPRLVGVASSRGSDFFANTLLPQLTAKQLNADFWIAFITQLHQADAGLQTCVAASVQALIDGLVAFPTHVLTESRYKYYSSQRTDKNIDEVLRVVKLFLEVGDLDACSRLFTKMRDAARSGTFALEFPPWMYYEALVSPFAALVGEDEAKLRAFRPFFEDVVFALLSGTNQSPNGAIAPCPLTEAQQQLVLDASRKAGGMEFLQRLTAAHFAGRDSHKVAAFTRFAAAQLSRDQHQYDKTMSVFVGIATEMYEHPSLDLQQSKLQEVIRTRMVDLVRLCFDVGQQAHCESVLVRFIHPPKGSDVEQHVSTILGPFLLQLADFLKSVDTDFTKKPFRKFSAAVVRSFSDQVVGPKPTAPVPLVAEIQGIGCTCEECDELRGFLLTGNEETHSFVRAAPIRTHLESELDATRAWGTTWETLKQRVPYTLKITKPPNMLALSRWKARCERAKSLLSSLGAEATQAEILGNDYQRIYSRVHDTECGPRPQNPLKRGASVVDASSLVKKVKKET